MLAASWQRLSAANVGFDRFHLITFLVRPSEAVYPAPKAPALIERVLSEIDQVPGVEAASVDSCFPVGTGCANSTLFIVGQPEPARDAAPPVLRHYIGPNHFQVLRVPLIRGREFTAADRAGTNRVTIINETAAKRFWPNENPLGKRVWFGGGSNFDRPDSSAEIVGIVGDVAYQHLDERPFQADFYTPYAQFTYATRWVVVRTQGNPLALVPALRRAVRRADPTLALFDVKTMDQRVSESWERVSYQTRVLGAFAIAAPAACRHRHLCRRRARRERTAPGDRHPRRSWRDVDTSHDDHWRPRCATGADRPVCGTHRRRGNRETTGIRGLRCRSSRPDRHAVSGRCNIGRDPWRDVRGVARRFGDRACRGVARRLKSAA